MSFGTSLIFRDDRQRWLFGTAVVLVALTCASTHSPLWADSPALPWNRLQLAKGIVVVVGNDTATAAFEVVRRTDLRVLAVVPTWENVVAARTAAQRAGISQQRLVFDVGDETSIPLTKWSANWVLDLNGRKQPTAEERRVLQPRGIWWSSQGRFEQPVPRGMDDWTHPYHSPDNNPASNDALIRFPYLTQFLADPRYAPAPQTAVAAAGRVYKVYGHVAWHEREEPFLNTIVAYDGFNGTQLWRYQLPEGMMVHRNVFVATDRGLYVGDHESCKLLDRETGQVIDEIRAPVDLVDGSFWKWMAIVDGTLYALVGEQETPARPVKWKRQQHGWPWNQISPGYNSPEQPWGFGRTILAIDLKTKSVRWHYREQQPIDARALCTNGQQIFAFRFGEYLTCLDARNGKVLWRRTKQDSPQLFGSLGEYLPRQSWRTNWRTVAYLKCTDDALYFAGPQLGKLLVVSAKDGRVLWEDPYDNYQLILRPDAVFAISGPWGVERSRKFDPLTGKVLAELPTGRRACTRPTATLDSILFRAMGGSVRLDIDAAKPRYISPMRPACHDGVTIANGHLYWWPYVCDCQLSLYGVTALRSADGFDFAPDFRSPARHWLAADPQPTAATSASAADWPTFRANEQATVTTQSPVAHSSTQRWQFRAGSVRLTAPTAAGASIFVAGDDGVVRAIDRDSGRLQWAAVTGGDIRIAPTYWKGRVIAGADDGWTYAWDAATGRPLWRYQAAPALERIPVYGKLLSRWPASSGVLIHGATAYVAAGRANYDGTYVYALDPATGEPRWCNDTSGFLDSEARAGVSVMGHMLFHNDRLYLAGGNAVSPGVYDPETGNCLNDSAPLSRCESTAPRGWELAVMGDRVVAYGMPFYSRPDLPVYDHTVTKKVLHARQGSRDVVWLDNRILVGFENLDDKELTACVTNEKIPRHITQAWGQFKVSQRPVWRFDCENSRAVAVGSDTVVVALLDRLVALDLDSGRQRWTVSLPAAPLLWGLALTREGDAVVSLEDGTLVCIGPPDKT